MKVYLWVGGITTLGVVSLPIMLTALRPWTSASSRTIHALWLVIAGVGLSVSVGYRFAGDPTWPAWWWLAMTGLGLGVIDVRHHRLPRPWVLAMGLGGPAVFAVVAVCTQCPEPLVRACAATALVFAIGVVLQWLFPGHMGFGDTTLYVALAPYWGWCGWHSVCVGITAAVLLLGAMGACAWLFTRRSWGSRIAAGPAVLLGGWIGVLT